VVELVSAENRASHSDGQGTAAAVAQNDAAEHKHFGGEQVSSMGAASTSTAQLQDLLGTQLPASVVDRRWEAFSSPLMSRADRAQHAEWLYCKARLLFERGNLVSFDRWRENRLPCRSPHQARIFLVGAATLYQDAEKMKQFAMVGDVRPLPSSLPTDAAQHPPAAYRTGAADWEAESPDNIAKPARAPYDAWTNSNSPMMRPKNQLGVYMPGQRNCTFDARPSSIQKESQGMFSVNGHLTRDQYVDKYVTPSSQPSRDKHSFFLPTRFR